MATKEEVVAQITSIGNTIREMKAAKKSKEELDPIIQSLLQAKEQYKQITGEAYQPPTASSKSKKKEKKPEKSKEEAKDPNKKSKKELNKEKKKAAKLAAKQKNQEGAPSDNKKPEAPAKSAAAGKPAAPALPLMQLKQGIPVSDKPQISYNSAALPIVSYMVATFLDKTAYFVAGEPSQTLPQLVLPEGGRINGDLAIARYLARSERSLGLYGYDDISMAQIDSMMDYAISHGKEPATASFLNEYLSDKSFMFGQSISLADMAMYAQFQGVAVAESLPHLRRWLDFCASQPPIVEAKGKLLKEANKFKKPVGDSKFVSQKGKETGSCPPLAGAIDGQVVTRFPPEPSGYLHIGHAKACILNNYYARHYNGKLIVRFDDTNPTKEKAEFEENIIQDLKTIGIHGDIVSYTSDHFPKMYKYAIQMIKEGKAYMDNTSQEQMRQERMDGINSAKRDTSVKENLDLFEKMNKGDAAANGYCLRAKIDMQAKNKTLRDPVLYRANDTPHHRTGTKYKAYPTYDFACPIVDSIEGVTHALRTTEYNDRDFQYRWIIEALGLRPVTIQSFARMNFTYSVLSKRKLQWFVDQGHVDGWNDPRFPTIQGVMRRGVQLEALREFILSQGASRRIVDMEWDKFWTMNKRVIDGFAKRFFGISKETAVKLTLTNIPKEETGISVALHPKNPEMGNKIMRFQSELLIEGDDAEQIVDNEEITLMRYGNVIIKSIERDAAGKVTHLTAEANPQGDFKKTKKKITWLANVEDLVEVKMVEFDHLIVKPKLEEGDEFKDFLTPSTRAETIALGDHGLRNLKQGDIIQLERRGYFRVDEPHISNDRPLTLFMIPDGKSKAMSTLSTKLAHR